MFNERDFAIMKNGKNLKNRQFFEKCALEVCRMAIFCQIL